ncbi:MAG: hypothetical protein J6B65_00295 [Paludibacteraceae bacterium]|nr:hypothetical protein [Paludibacteraceae bacterium]MBO5085663.1 hypothetical protein [Paludibacteraceae bacterium]
MKTIKQFFPLIALIIAMFIGCNPDNNINDNHNNSNDSIKNDSIKNDSVSNKDTLNNDTITIKEDTIDNVETEPFYIVKSSRPAWYNEHPMASTEADFSVKTDAVRLHFYGWGLDEDSVITVKFPESTTQYNRAILTYRMGGWNEGPADWDMTTMIMLKNPHDGKFYEIVRAFTPYGGYFDANWEKLYYMDITEYLPMLNGDVEFHIYYGGWDATDKKAHTVTLTFDFYEGAKEKETIYYEKIYDSRASSNIGYRSWAYGVEGHSIEETERLGLREIQIPENIKSLLMKVSISGHGADRGVFPDRGTTGKGTRANNAAEFDENFYRIVINDKLKYKGHIFYDNGDTYRQAGTYKYDRANWGPGLPLKVDWIEIHNIPEDGKLNLDFNLDNFNSKVNDLKGEGVANYIIEVDIFGYNN